MLIRWQTDSSSLAAGTEAMLTSQEAAAARQKAIWNREARAQVAAAEQANAEVLAIEARRLEKQAELNRAWMAEQAAVAAAGAGSGGYGSGFKTAEQVALEGGEAAAGGAALAGAAKGTEEVAKEAHGFAGILRESAVILREGLRGNFTRMIGSATILAGLLGGWAVAIGTATAAIAAYPAYLYWKANKAAEDSQKSLEKTSQGAAGDLKKQVEDLAAAGILSKKDAAVLRKQLEDPTGDASGVLNVILAAGRVSKLTAKWGGRQELHDRAEAQRQNDQKQKELEGMTRHERTESEILTDIANKRRDASEMELRLFRLDKADTVYIKAKNQLLQDQIDLKKDLEELGKKEKERNQINLELMDLTKERKGIYHEAADIDNESPTIAELAGRRFMKNLAKEYGSGGIFDLEDGAGPFAEAAQNAALAAQQQRWDIIHGNAVFNSQGELIGGQAFEDRSRRMRFENYLGNAGLETPAMKMEKLGAQLLEINAHIAELVNLAGSQGIIISGTN